MKKGLISLVLVVLLISLLVAGCAKPAPTTTPTPTATPTTPAKVIELKLTHHDPPVSNTQIIYEQWAKEMEKRTGGRVKITLYPAGTLAKMPDAWYAVKQGIADIAFIIPSAYAGVFPLCDAPDLPFVTAGMDISDVNKLFDKYLNKEMGEAKVLFPSRASTVEIHMHDKAVNKMEDLKGVQIRIAPGPLGAALSALGATPASIAPAELYGALERGMIGATCSPFSLVKSYKLFDVTKYHIMVGIGGGVSTTLMNLAKWNSLPPDIQKIFNEVDQWAQVLKEDASNVELKECFTLAKAAGNTVIFLAPEERARWAEVTKPGVDKWAADMDAKGKPGTEIIKYGRELSAGKYQKMVEEWKKW